ncbi:Site-specific DNA-methyltransferase [Leuconostoc citreum KM20]|uniref:Site-specific DNA-methyltransferase n=1 Tax=Leuconostoc citreum (strain KM20) TaxID=349519 RepID=B1MYV3_LEUCK|nr:Site-specific DNA-methyltransferase [Leuconostoc citreum KM20]
MDVNRKNHLLTLLAAAQESVVNNVEIPTDFARDFFPPERKEYELTYFDKENQQSVISKTFAAPIQLDRTFGKAGQNEWINKIIFGDNLQVLKTLIEWKKDGLLKNKDGSDGVRVVYIDPPFASKQDFQNKDQKAYSDKLKGVEYLEWLRKRLILLREILADDGNIFVHLDWHKMHYVKVLMDEIFGEANFVNDIVWSYRTGRGGNSEFNKQHDDILFYSKQQKHKFNPQREKSYTKSKNRKPGLTNYGKATTEFFEDAQGVYRWSSMRDVWDIPYINSQSKERVGYPTQKPEALLEIIIGSASDAGDLVLDLFGGSGVTAAVAEKMDRRWITGDVGKLSIYVIQKRILALENYHSFGVYNAGHYDESKMKTFTSHEWKKFAMSLYDVEPSKEIIKGFSFDGVKDGELVKVYSPQDLDTIGGPSTKITEKTLLDIYERVGLSLGPEVFIIAPQGKFGFAVDEYDHDGDWNTLFTILRVPYTLMARFTESFSAIKQANDRESINAVIDAVGFDFIRPPKVEFEIKDNVLSISSFDAESRIKGEYKTHGFDAFSMVLVDNNYDGKIFNFTNFYFNTDFKNYSLYIPELVKGKRIMLIFIDKFGNEFKTDMELK